MEQIKLPIQVNLPDDWVEQILNRMRNDPEADWVDVIRCKDCKHFHYDMPYVIQGFPVFGHDVCDFWGDGCKTSENGFCSFAEKEGEK